MVNKYTITVKNQSGAQQHYALFNKPPVVTGRVQGQIWANVFATGNTPSNSVAHFQMLTQYYGIVGSSQGTPADGVVVDVTGERAVELGQLSSNGTQVPGTTLTLKVVDEAPQFDQTPNPNGSYVNAFEIRSGTDFTIAEAKKGNYMIGLGGSKTGASDGPAATFVPEPNVDYQIQPVNTYFLTFGDYTKGAIIDVNKIGTVATVDYTQMESDVTIIHDAHGNLNIQKTE